MSNSDSEYEFGERFDKLQIKADFGSKLKAFADACPAVDYTILVKMRRHDRQYLKGPTLPERLKYFAETLHKGNGCPGKVTRQDIEDLFDGIPADWYPQEQRNEVKTYLDTLYPPHRVLRDREELTAAILRKRAKQREKMIRQFDEDTKSLLDEIQ